jgi:hypothetical protein
MTVAVDLSMTVFELGIGAGVSSSGGASIGDSARASWLSNRRATS